MKGFQSQGRKLIQKALNQRQFKKFEGLAQSLVEEEISCEVFFKRAKQTVSRDVFNRKVLPHLRNYFPKSMKNVLDEEKFRAKKTQISKTLTFLLRHKAHKEGLSIDDEGFVPVAQLINNRQLKRHKLTLEMLKEVVETCRKKRFSIKVDENGQHFMRANQVKNLELKEIKTAEICVHGTYYNRWTSIKKQGLKKMGRQHIHMAPGMPNEKGVISGMRASCNLLIFINVEKAVAAGIRFYLSANNVILSPDVIPVKFFDKVVDRRNGEDLLKRK